MILQFHPKNGKHYVEFGNIGEKRWCNMKKYAFYITERPLTSNHNQHNNTGGNANREDQQADHEYKDDQDDIIPNLAPIEVSIFLLSIYNSL